MKTEDYPRPHDDTGLGFVFFPDADHAGRAEAERWIPRLQALGTSWLVMITPPSRPVPDAFLQRLMMADVEPIVIVSPERIGPPDRRVLRETLGALADSGVHYVALFDRPNDRASWSAADWGKPALVERFVDCLSPALELAVAEGLIPVLPPLEPFGAYWDLTFLQAMLESLCRRGLGTCLKRAAVGMRNFANNRPLDWGHGGRQAWPGARPYVDQPEGQDHRGFRLYEWYQTIILERLGYPLPLLSCANGPQPSTMADPTLDPQVHAQRVGEMVKLMGSGEVPASVLNHAFWVLAAERGQPGYQEAWFEADGQARLPAGGVLHRLVQGGRPIRSATAGAVDASETTTGRPASVPKSAPLNGRKPIGHYLLLPRFDWGISRWYLAVVQGYVEAHMPTCGFSVEEAKLAQRVTIVGDEQGVNSAAAQALAAAGCQVERIAGRDNLETERLLQQLARNVRHKHP